MFEIANFKIKLIHFTNINFTSTLNIIFPTLFCGVLPSKYFKDMYNVCLALSSTRQV